MIKERFFRFFYRLHGWSFVGRPVPVEVDRCVLVFAPHTSNWDFYFGVMFMLGWGVPYKVVIKNAWTKFPLNLLIETLGGVGIDRSLKKKGEILSQVDLLASAFEKYHKIAFIITPEGTRAKRNKWKTGFYHIAKKANVPIVTITCNFEKKSIEFGPVFPIDQKMESIMPEMMKFFMKKGIAESREKFAPDSRYI